MPCFKGIAVSIHSESTPLPELSTQKHNKSGRITSYVPVPPPKVSGRGSSKTEKSRFAISITLLTPGLPIPYSTPKATPENPHPKPQYVTVKDEDGVPRQGGVGPYVPITSSHHETIAAYIYFDGRVKEEVATLLRPGEETWVNSRWVQDGSGGLAEREFLFREVGLERWLNGLDLEKEGQQAKIEQRREKLRKRRERQQEKMELGQKGSGSSKKWAHPGQGLLVYGSDIKSPVEEFSEEESEDDDDDEPPESTGQIKVAMFRVLASGEIKKGEYSPQFDANDDGDAMDAGNDDEADHTTSFAKPKALDPKTISTQTVTGLDGPEAPYAVFTFLYRGERQLKKMGILQSAKGKEPSPTTGKRASRLTDFSNLPPLKSTGTVGFTNFRDGEASGPKKSRKKTNGGTSAPTSGGGDESDEDEDEDIKLDEADAMEDDNLTKILSPEESKFSGELAEGVNRIKLKRQRSTDHNPSRQSPSLLNSPTVTSTPSPDLLTQGLAPPLFNGLFSGVTNSLETSAIGSPMKKHRSSVLGSNSDAPTSLPASDVLGAAEAGRLEPKTFVAGADPNPTNTAMDDDDDLEL